MNISKAIFFFCYLFATVQTYINHIFTIRMVLTGTEVPVWYMKRQDAQSVASFKYIVNISSVF